MNKKRTYIIWLIIVSIVELICIIYSVVVAGAMGLLYGLCECLIFLPLEFIFLINPLLKINKSEKQIKDIHERAWRNLQKEEAKKKEFYENLKERSFIVSNDTCGFIIDTEHKKWCKLYGQKIFDFSEAVEAKINRHRSSEVTTSGSSSGNGTRSSNSYRGLYSRSRYSSGSSRSSRSGTTSRTSKDTSTYEVLIKTTDIAEPLVIINCSKSKSSAEKICATVDIMREKKTRNTVKEEDNGGQTEFTD